VDLAADPGWAIPRIAIRTNAIDTILFTSSSLSLIDREVMGLVFEAED
jgi:hypothetical protein